MGSDCLSIVSHSLSLSDVPKNDASPRGPLSTSTKSPATEGQKAIDFVHVSALVDVTYRISRFTPAFSNRSKATARPAC